MHEGLKSLVTDLIVSIKTLVLQHDQQIGEGGNTREQELANDIFSVQIHV